MDPKLPILPTTICVVVNGTQSLTLPVVSRVPQGSVLDPLLFLIYINDITCVISNGKVSVYANDIVLYQIICSPMDSILLQQDVNSICAWVDQNLLLLNTLKCFYFNFFNYKSLHVMHGYRNSKLLTCTQSYNRE